MVAPPPRGEEQLARGQWEVSCPDCGHVPEPLRTAEPAAALDVGVGERRDTRGRPYPQAVARPVVHTRNQVRVQVHYAGHTLRPGRGGGSIAQAGTAGTAVAEVTCRCASVRPTTFSRSRPRVALRVSTTSGASRTTRA